MIGYSAKHSFINLSVRYLVNHAAIYQWTHFMITNFLSYKLLISYNLPNTIIIIIMCICLCISVILNYIAIAMHATLTYVTSYFMC